MLNCKVKSLTKEKKKKNPLGNNTTTLKCQSPKLLIRSQISKTTSVS